MTDTYSGLKSGIRNCLNNAAEDFFMVGYFLRQISENALFTEDGYQNIWEFAKGEYGLSASSASRFMAINARFSIDGGEHMDQKYIGMGVSRLQEMLGLPDEELEKVTKETTVREIRAMKKKQGEPKSFFGLPKTEYPEGSLISTPGCGGKHHCFSCAHPCGIRQEERHCRTAPCGNPFPCTQMDEEKRLEMEAGLYSGECLHLHPELAPVRAGDKEPEPCCLECGHKTCYSRCDVAKKRDGDGRRKEQAELRKEMQKRQKEAGAGEADRPGKEAPAEQGTAARGPLRDAVREKGRQDREEKEAAGQAAAEPEDPDIIDAEFREVREDPQDPEEGPAQEKEGGRIRNRAAEAGRILAQERKKLDSFLEMGGFPEETVFRQEIIVEALSALVSGLEKAQAGQEQTEAGQEERRQPPLPVLKNDAGRRAWLRAYKDWGLWYRDENTGAEYYKYEFGNGAVLAAEVYQEEETEYMGAYESCFLHLYGGPEPPEGRYGCPRWPWHKKYSRHPDSETELIEFLKCLQKDMKQAR